MKSVFSETAKCNTECEIRLGVASWDNGDGTELSVKFTWFNEKDGKAARGGEMPVKALPQALDFAIRKGFLTLTCEE